MLKANAVVSAGKSRLIVLKVNRDKKKKKKKHNKSYLKCLATYELHMCIYVLV